MPESAPDVAALLDADRRIVDATRAAIDHLEAMGAQKGYG
jgi:hypothetical protein